MPKPSTAPEWMDNFIFSCLDLLHLLRLSFNRMKALWRAHFR
jgi:hypothetical protein